MAVFFLSAVRAFLATAHEKMKAMIIKDDLKLVAIQHAFQAKFPYLKLEFYAARHEAGEGSPQKDKLDPELTLREVRQKHTEGDLRIRGAMPVRDFEQAVYEKFGLNAQVFRKSGNIWMQTTATDHWTLEEQNRKGGSSETHYQQKYNP